MEMRVGTVSAINKAAGTVDVNFPGRTSPGLWLMDSVRIDTITIGASVVCLFSANGGEGFCLGRHYNQNYTPAATLTINQNVHITQNLNVSGTISAANLP